MEYHFLSVLKLENPSSVSMDSMNIFTLFYLLFSFCMVFPIPVFVSCGLTVESLFGRWLGSERKSFIEFHLRRIVATIIFQGSLPLGYVVLRLSLGPEIDTQSGIVFWQTIFSVSLVPFLVSVLLMYYWVRNDYKEHPVAEKLRAFIDDGDTKNMRDVAREIDNDFRSPHKIIIHCDPTSKVIATRNWLIKTSSYDLDIGYQSGVTLRVLSSDEHVITADNQGSVQFLKIKVTSTRRNVYPFYLRLNSTNLRDLQDLMARPILIKGSIKLLTTLKERFLVAFKEQVRLNPTVSVLLQVEDSCWGCSDNRPNVKLAKTCGDSEGVSRCVACQCKPMWCVDCMGAWFASRQDQDKPEEWMSAKCTCPLCRRTFCILDVCYIHELDSVERHPR